MNVRPQPISPAPEGPEPEALLFPRVPPLEGPVSRLSIFLRLLRNPLRVLPASVYEEPFVLGGRAGRQICWIAEPSLIKTMLLDKHQSFRRTAITHRILGPLLGNGILTADGADWKWQRQTSAPVFRHHDLLNFVPTIAAAADRLVAAWRADAKEATRDIDRDMSLVTFDIIAHTLLPSSGAALAPMIANASIDFQKPLGWQLALANFRLPRWTPHPGKIRMRVAQRRLRSGVGDLVAERRTGTAAQDDLLQRLMNAQHPETGAAMSDVRLVDNLLTFFLAGHETTAKALTWTLYILARAPEWQRRVREEVKQVVGERPVEPADIDRLTVTTQVLKESMRLFPPAPIMSRQADVDIDLGGLPLTAGTQIIVPIYAIQRHRRYWTDPDRFDPVRFAPENEAKISRYHYMPFGAGPRICIGMAFALIEAVAILATLVRAAEFTTRPDHAPEALSRVTLRPAGGMRLSARMQ